MNDRLHLACPSMAAHDMTSRCCPVCASTDAEAMFSNDMAPIAAIDFSYVVVACNACGTTYASRSPSDVDLARYYRDYSKYDHPQTLADIGAGDRFRAETTARFARRFVEAGQRVLDVGCSIGLFLATLARHATIETRGLDPSPRSAEVARRLLGVEVEVGDAYDFADYRAFDVITLLAVLEHLRDPARLFDTIARRMRDGATLVIEVPDADAFGGYAGMGTATEPFGEFSNEHINFFGVEALCRLAARSGLRYLDSDRFVHPAGPCGLLVAFHKGAGAAPPSDPMTTRLSIARYVRASHAAMVDVESRLAASSLLEASIVLYGAGSHSARLLAQTVLATATIDVVIDRNVHLTGRTIGKWPIAQPDALANYPDHPVVVSSFLAQEAIVAALRRLPARPIVTPYPDRGTDPVISALPRP